MDRMRAATLLTIGLALSCCQAKPSNMATIGTLNCQTGGEAACATSASGRADPGYAHALAVQRDVQAILEGMQQAQ
jgi:hypothetical protein